MGKKYRIRHQQERQRYLTLRDVLADRTKSVAKRLWSLTSVLRPPTSGPRSPLSSLPSSRSSTEDFWALRGISLEVKQGEILGVIGRNGAGKTR